MPVLTINWIVALYLTADPAVQGAPAEAVRAWSTAPFSTKPAEMLDLAARGRQVLVKQVGDHPPTVILWESLEYEVNNDRVWKRHHVVHVALSEEGAERAERIWVGYNRKRQMKPRIEARVVMPNGRSVLWNQAALDRIAAAVPDAEWVTLPNVKPGCLVETVRTTQEREPLLPGGASGYTFLQDYVWATRVRVVAPAASALRGLTSGVVNVREQRRNSNQHREIEWTAGPQRFTDPAAPPRPENLVPSIAWTTWKSWPDISARLASVIEPRIRPADVAAVSEQAIAGATNSEEIAARLFTLVTRSLRFEKGSVADHGLVPNLSSDTMKAGAASARDMAATLVAALRARGLQANLVLAQWLFRMMDDLPTLDNFDTPLVMVTGPGLNAPIWLDVMYGSGPNDITIELGSKRALPVRQGGADLLALPPTTRTRRP